MPRTLLTDFDMKAPDKIYFPEDGLPAYIDWDGSPVSTKPVGDNDICYIRKDALLEWANEKASLAGVLKREAYQNVIDKINSL